MIEINRAPLQVKDLQVKIVGVGGAGCHAVDRLSKEGLSGGDLIVANTDARSLNACLTTTKIPLGQNLTRGLGAGGDPDVGRAAVEECLESVGGYLAGASVVIILAGLGGGTGSGSAPRIAEAAREHGAHVVVLTTMPFSFEGKRRGEQAVEALEALRENADLVICFENDRMSALVDASAGVAEAFGSVDALWVQAVRAIVSMTKRQAIMSSGLDEISAALSGSYSTALFGHGVADGDDRVNDALRTALSSPLFGADGEISAATGLWVYVAGGSDLRWAEVQLLMTEINRQVSQEIRLFFGAAIDPHLNGTISVTLLAGVPCMGQSERARSERRKRDASAAMLLSKLPPPLAGSVASVLPEQLSEHADEHVPAHEVEEFQGYRPPGLVDTEREAESVFFVESEALIEELARPVVLTDVEEEVLPQDGTKPAPDSESQNSPLVEDETAPVVSKPLAKPPFERASELRRDIGAALLKRKAAVSLNRTDHLSVPAKEGVPTEIEEDAPMVADAGTIEHEVVEESEVPPVADSPIAESRENDAPKASQENHSPPHSRTKPSVQEQMHFEPVNRGRFEKTDPTMVDGQDLDVPTFMRRKVSIAGEPPSVNPQD